MLSAAGVRSPIKSSHPGNHTEGEAAATASNLSEVYPAHSANSAASE